LQALVKADREDEGRSVSAYKDKITNSLVHRTDLEPCKGKGKRCNVQGTAGIFFRSQRGWRWGAKLVRRAEPEPPLDWRVLGVATHVELEQRRSDAKTPRYILPKRASKEEAQRVCIIAPFLMFCRHRTKLLRHVPPSVASKCYTMIGFALKCVKPQG